MKKKGKGYYYSSQVKPYISQNSRRIRRKKIIFWSSVSVLLILAITLTLVFTLKDDRTPEEKAKDKEKQEILANQLPVEQLLFNNDYQALSERSNKELDENPYSAYWLKLRGLSLYQLAAQQISEAESEHDNSTSLEQAITDLTLSLTLAPKDDLEMIYILLGKAYFAKGYFFMDSAIHYFTYSLNILNSGKSLFPKNQIEANKRIILYYLGSAYAEIGEYQKSIECFSQIEGESKSKLHSAVSYYHDKNYLKAYELLQDIIDHSTDTNLKNSCLNWKAKIYFEEGRYEDAMAIYESLIEKFPNSPEPLYHLGMIHYQINNKIKARAYFRQAAAKETPYPKANEALMTYF